MYALSFDMEVDKLKEYYGKAYDEIIMVMGELDFEWTQGYCISPKVKKYFNMCL